MAEFTPGPWVTNNVIVIDTKGNTICRLMHNSEDGPVIAAVPDLYEALALWKASDEEINEGAKQVARQIAREKRDAALAKAEAKE